MSTRVVRGFLEEVWNQGHGEAAELYVDPRYEVPGVGRGPRAVAENMDAFRVAFPDLRLDVDDLVANDERVAVWMRLSGTHLGPFRGYAPTGTRATWDEVGFFFVEGDRIDRARYLADMLGLRKALGVIPSDLR
jgi:predicted ester cyclase